MALKPSVPPKDVERALVQFGQNLRQARLRRNVTIEQVAQKIGVSRQTLADAEMGKAGTGVGVYVGELCVLGLADQLAEVGALAREPEKVLASLPKRQRARQKKGG